MHSLSRRGRTHGSSVALRPDLKGAKEDIIETADLAAALYEARRTRTPIPPLTDSYPDMTAEDAYAVQEKFIGLLLADGGRVVGWKLGLTSRPMQELLGVYQPDYAPIVSSMVYEDGVSLDLTDYIQPRVEAEIALSLDAPLKGPNVTPSEAATAVSGVSAAIEMVDSRIMDWKIKFADTVSDLASCGAIVTGRRVPPDFDLRLCGMVIVKNGDTVATGAGGAALGDPLNALAWLANALSPYNAALEPGQIIMTGALHAAFPVAAGDHVVAEFDRLGSVNMHFKGGGR